MPADGRLPEEDTLSAAKTPGDGVTIARLLKTRGRHGELAALSLSSHPERFAQLDEVMLKGAAGFPDEVRVFSVEEVWEHGPRLIFKFAGIDTISDAEELCGAEVQVPERERFPLPEGEYYQSDLVGCEVVEQSDGRRLGVVDEFQDVGGNGLLRVVDAAGHEILIPFTKAICVEIDVGKRRIVVNPPEGLLELNG